MKLGTTEEWTVRNTSAEQHPFHIHQDDFQVMSVNGEPYTAHSEQDTVVVPIGGEVVIRMHVPRLPRQLGVPLPHPRPRGRRDDGRGRHGRLHDDRAVAADLELTPPPKPGADRTGRRDQWRRFRRGRTRLVQAAAAAPGVRQVNERRRT